MTDLYEKLSSTAKAFLSSCLPRTLGSNDASREAILSTLAPSFRMDFGHKFFVSTKPMLQGESDGEGFVKHLTGMAPALQTWSIDLKSTCVDVQNRSVVLRSDFHMVPKGGEEVLNDIVLWLVMDESGEKLIKATEFVDPTASAELGDRMRSGTENAAKLPV